eukprot:TRINITY_DN15449_c0_g1_i3.p1 TRINITY_DN15449_c0_g1~~TRINITY_DN15449_c0_g1_i3.p1  ORF type:complete len:329 (-),score=97.63 TRINITY_DN15449_c0_g1_i3:198-1184(-)
MDMAEIDNLRVEILQLGKSNFLDLEDEQIEEILGGGSLLASHVRDMFPRKPGSSGLRGRQTLIFYRQYWKVVVTHRHTKRHEGPVIDVERGKILANAVADEFHNIIVFDKFPSKFVTSRGGGKNSTQWIPQGDHEVGFLVPNREMKMTRENIYGIVRELWPKFPMKEIEFVRSCMYKFSCASFKSLLQKIIRFAPLRVEVECLQNDPRGDTLDTSTATTSSITSRGTGSVGEQEEEQEEEQEQEQEEEEEEEDEEEEDKNEEKKVKKVKVFGRTNNMPRVPFTNTTTATTTTTKVTGVGTGKKNNIPCGVGSFSGSWRVDDFIWIVRS